MKRGRAAAGPAKKQKTSSGDKPEKEDTKLKEELEIYENLFFNKYCTDLVDQGLRHDGRKLLEPRPVGVTCGVLSTAHGSAMVSQGASKVICGVKGMLAPAQGSNGDEGRIEIRCMLSEVAEAGVSLDMLNAQQRGNAIAQFVKKMLEATQTIDCKLLCLKENTVAWNIHADVYILNSDGSLKDTCLHAVVAALLNTTLPAVEVKDDETCLRPDSKGLALGIKKYPISLTMGSFKGSLFTDITQREESLGGGITVVHDSTSKLVNIQKEGGTPFTEEALRKCADHAKSRAKSIKQEIEKGVGSKEKKGSLF